MVMEDIPAKDVVAMAILAKRKVNKDREGSKNTVRIHALLLRAEAREEQKLKEGDLFSLSWEKL